ncbi:MAG: 7-cyano-7-deazaguanine synthase QueC [Candidatus Kapaibacteriota bacterium]
MKPLAIVLMSGGMDSTVCASWALQQGFEVCALHVHYGQKTQEREAQAFNEICAVFRIDKILDIDISHLAAIGGSSLTDSTIDITKANLESSEIPTSYVPFRNANLLSIAVSWAEVIGAQTIIIGAVEEDGSGYPDCRRIFFDAFEAMIQLGTKPGSHIQIQTPLIASDKAEIVTLGMKLEAPLELTWSCYSSSEKACGVCDSCALRLRGFAKAGYEDPIEYDQRPDYI